MKEVLKSVDGWIGAIASNDYVSVYLVRSGGYIVGVCVTESRCQGYLVAERNDALIEQVDISVGIKRIWVSSSHRRMGVGMWMMDVVREKEVYACVLPKNKVGFSQPTQLGWMLAKQWYQGKVVVYPE
jgi:N-acetyltransferase